MAVFISTVHFLLLLLFLFIVSACDKFPLDPENTLTEIKQQRSLNVCVFHAPPYTEFSGNQIKGIEITLLQKFSTENNIKVSFHKCGIEEGFEKLKKYEVDVIAGGLVKSNPYKEVGYTRPYHEKHVLAVARGENRFVVELEKFMALHAEPLFFKKESAK